MQGVKAEFPSSSLSLLPILLFLISFLSSLPFFSPQSSHNCYNRYQKQLKLHLINPLFPSSFFYFSGLSNFKKGYKEGKVRKTEKKIKQANWGRDERLEGRKQRKKSGEMKGNRLSPDTVYFTLHVYLIRTQQDKRAFENCWWYPDVQLTVTLLLLFSCKSCPTL